MGDAEVQEPTGSQKPSDAMGEGLCESASLPLRSLACWLYVGGSVMEPDEQRGSRPVL